MPIRSWKHGGLRRLFVEDNRDLKGFWSVTITGNWRVIFRFAGSDAFDVNLTDYH
jgi:plasmid maintenance system killer protein